MRTVTATRYVTPLREGGSLPGLVEADDDGLYVLKFRGAGQGPRALVAEVVVGELARRLGFPVPELVTIELDPAIGRAEPDPEIQDLLLASEGVNLGVDFLPAALPFSPAAGLEPDGDFAAEVVWLDALVTNIDRTPQNPNLLEWHRRIWLIDHGAALYWHHTRRRPSRAPTGSPPCAGTCSCRTRHRSATPTNGSPGRCRPSCSRPSPPRCRLTGSTEPTPSSMPITCAPVSPSRAGSWRRPRMPAGSQGEGSPFSYAVYRVVPRVERGEQINAGVIVFSRPLGYLEARTALDSDRALALWPGLDVDAVRSHLAAIERIAAGDREAGPIAALEFTERFHWLVAPSSTIIQPSEVHTGICADPAAKLARLFDELVAATG